MKLSCQLNHLVCSPGDKIRQQTQPNLAWQFFIPLICFKLFPYAGLKCQFFHLIFSVFLLVRLFVFFVLSDIEDECKVQNLHLFFGVIIVKHVNPSCCLGWLNFGICSKDHSGRCEDPKFLFYMSKFSLQIATNSNKVGSKWPLIAQCLILDVLVKLNLFRCRLKFVLDSVI